ncbi:MAG: nitroreductase family protein [Desulfocucumaceae bacterium]
MEAIRNRRTVREFQADPVPIEHIRLMVEAATLAPSGYNRQPWKFILIQDPQLKARMAQEVRDKVAEIEKWPSARGKEVRVKSSVRGYTVFDRAPVSIAVLTKEYTALIDEIYCEKGLSFEERFILRGAPGIQSVAAAIENMLLAATSLGYGTCWGTGCLVAKDAMEKLLEVELPWRLLAVVSVGIPKVNPGMPRRKTVDEVLEVR